MCEFISWIKKGNKTYFLTYDQIYNTPRGEILRKQVNSEKPWDFYGHDAIRRYFELHDIGIEEECTDFSTPANFPSVIVKAIKEGKLRGMAYPRGLLRAPLYADYKSKCDALYADYKSKFTALYADYKSKCATLYADYKSKCAALDADYKSKCAALDADYKSKRAALDKKFWDLFAIPKNRNPKWK